METVTTSLSVRPLDPAALTAEQADDLATVANAAAVVDAAQLVPVGAEHERLRHAYGWDMLPTHALRGAYDSDQMVGWSAVHLSEWDNPRVAGIELEVHPEHRGRGVEKALVDEAEEVARAAGRTLLLAEAWLDSDAERFWAARGWPVASRAAQRRILTADLDRDNIAGLRAEAEAASGGYDLVVQPIPAPDDLVPQLLALHLSMNDAPIDDLDIDDEQWPPQRHRGWEQAMAARRYRVHQLLARRRSDGELGGFTQLLVDGDRPHLGIQEDTGVIAGHRGHRLGLRLKTAMLERLAELEPQITLIDTWNAESNRHMLAVNDALGCVVVGRAAEVQHTR